MTPREQLIFICCEYGIVIMFIFLFVSIIARRSMWFVTIPWLVAIGIGLVIAQCLNPLN